MTLTDVFSLWQLALRAGNEKEEDTADTVGCCSLRVEHLKLCELLDGKEWVVEFDFLGKDSIRYYNKVCVEKRVFKNLQLFMENKQAGDDLFDRLNVSTGFVYFCFNGARIATFGSLALDNVCKRILGVGGCRNIWIVLP